MENAFKSISDILAQLATLESTIQTGINKAATISPMPDESARGSGGTCGFDGPAVAAPMAKQSTEHLIDSPVWSDQQLDSNLEKFRSLHQIICRSYK